VHEYCDIHNHLLHEVDDGSTSIGETLRYLREFRAHGVTDLVFTPHLLAPGMRIGDIDATLELHRARFEEVLAATAGDPSVPRLGLGQEILARQPEDLDRVLERTDVGLGGGEALLVEFGFSEGFDGDAVVQRVVASGRRLVVAHPERYRYGAADPVAAAARWRKAGAMLQLNGGSLAGLYTPHAWTLACDLLEEGLVELVCTDHHGDDRAHSTEMIAATLRDADMAPEELMGSGPRRAHEGAFLSLRGLRSGIS
jgi:protein-tyrosine phosphatase